MSFGTNLSALRKQRGLSQEEFGAALGVSRQTIYTWEADISSPNIENLRAIADYFGCTVDKLIRGEAFSEQPDASGRGRAGQRTGLPRRQGGDHGVYPPLCFLHRACHVIDSLRRRRALRARRKAKA